MRSHETMSHNRLRYEVKSMCNIIAGEIPAQTDCDATMPTMMCPCDPFFQRKREECGYCDNASRYSFRVKTHQPIAWLRGLLA